MLSHKNDPQSSFNNRPQIDNNRATVRKVLRRAKRPLTSHEIASRCHLDYIEVARRVGEVANNMGLQECTSGKVKRPVSGWSLSDSKS